MTRRLLFALVLAAPTFGVRPAAAQEPATFGQNKVVLRDFDWKLRRTEHFDLYYYEDSAAWVERTAGILERAYREVAGGLKVGFDARRPFFLYASVNDMQQTNIVTVGDGVGGVTEPFKDRFMAYADGSEDWLETVIRHEYVHVVQFRVLVDGFWRSARVLKTVVYPLWFMEGLAEYHTGEHDKTQEDMVLRDAATSGRLFSLVRLHHVGHLKPHQVTPAYKESGAAVRFLEEQYGKGKAGEMLWAFQGRFDASSALQEVVGTDLHAFDRKFREYLEDRYARQVRDENLKEPAGRALTPLDDSIPQFNTGAAYGPDGDAVFYLTTRAGFPPVVEAKDLKTGRAEVVVGRRHEWVDNVPLGRFSEISRELAVSPDGRTLAFAGQKNHRERVFLADRRTGDLRWLAFNGLMTVGTPAFSPDGSKLAFSGMRHGRTDIYLYDLKERKLRNLTNTPDDDLSPAFTPDGRGLVYSTEVNRPDQAPEHQRDLFFKEFETGKVDRLTSMQGSERDPVVSPDGTRVLFTADPDYVNDLYELELATGRIARRTRSVGGSFNASYSPDGSKLVYSAYRKGSVAIYEATPAELLDEAYAPAPPAATAAAEEPPTASTGPVRLSADEPYRFAFSTDLFLPAFFFSSQGGLFWTSYWQGSDFLGNHQIQNFINYNSGQGFLNYNLTYTYGRYRPQWVFGAQGLQAKDVEDEKTRLEYDLKLHRQFFGVGYPFDRFHRLEVVGIHQVEIKDFQTSPRKDDNLTRGVGVSFVRDTVEGRYLVATRGSRLRLGLTRGIEAFGGNQDFTTWQVEGQQFIPTGGQSALALRAVTLLSSGPDAEDFRAGGVGGIRGIHRSLNARAGHNLVFANLEWRFPVVQNLDYYLWFIFPDLYFKAIFGTVFYDIGHAWERRSQVRGIGYSGVADSAGVGLRVHTFVLQRFPFVIAADWAHQVGGKNKILYIYLGPTF